MGKPLLFPEKNKVIVMDNLQKNIELAIENGLFNSEKTDDNQVFDFYGNYNFPTDFSNSEGNTILSVSQYNSAINNN